MHLASSMTVITNGQTFQHIMHKILFVNQ